MCLFSRASKGFSGQNTVKYNGCVDIFVDAIKVFLRALDVPVQRTIIFQGVRQFLHQMVMCLDADFLEFIPIAMESLLKNSDAKELCDFITFANQVIQKFKVCNVLLCFLAHVLSSCL